MSVFTPPAAPDQETDPLLPALVITTEDHCIQVADLASYVRELIEGVVQVPVKTDHIVRSTDELERICKKTLQRVEQASVYVVLLSCKQWREEAARDYMNKALLESRAMFAEILAMIIISRYERFDDISEMLTSQFDDNRSTEAPIQNALSLAVDASADRFVADARVHVTLMNIWMGNCVFTRPTAQQLEQRVGKGKARQILQSTQHRERGHCQLQFSFWKLKVPRYQYYTSVVIYFFYLGIYTFVVNRRTATPEPAEIALYVLVLSFIVEHVKSMALTSRNYNALALWNWVDYGSYALFLAAFTYRAIGIRSHDEADRVAYRNISYNFLSTVSVLLWFRLLELLDTFRKFGYLLITVRRMLQDAVHFFILIGVLLVGFTQAYYGLALSNVNESAASTSEQPMKVIHIVNMLLKGLLSLMYEEAAAIDMFLGTLLYHVYLFVSFFIFMNLLIAVFNNSYQEVLDRNEAEYQMLFAQEILQHIYRAYEVPFIPPANLIEVLFMPIRRCLPQRTFQLTLEYVCAVIFVPEVVAIALFEMVYPPKVQTHIASLTRTNLPVEAWRLDMEISNNTGETSGGMTAPGVHDAKQKATDPSQTSERSQFPNESRRTPGESTVLADDLKQIMASIADLHEKMSLLEEACKACKKEESL
ncbi:hypothetical protein HDU85_003952 [Gaertneriomyces sp. JEL0708]|nr:hypothetical protein HDU85_003952 [Gaertneriomyces sp. JEL0708]